MTATAAHVRELNLYRRYGDVIRFRIKGTDETCELANIRTPSP